MDSAAAVIGAEFALAVRPKPRLRVSEWADAHIYLSRKGASEPGKWRTSRAPFTREIMDCLSPQHPCTDVVLMASTQIAKTSIGLNWIGYVIDQMPAPMLAVLPTVLVATRWSKQRLASTIAESPALRVLIKPSASRDGGNTLDLKEFPGGMLIIGGANSAASLASMPIRFLLLDEVDKYPLDADDEGDPVDLAEARTTTFPRRKIFKCSSPTVKSLSRIDKEWSDSDQRHYHVPCPHCHEKQSLRYEQIILCDDGAARYACAACGVLIDEQHKTAMLARGEWIATFPERPKVGFHLNALYTPAGLGRTWTEHELRRRKVVNDPARYKVWVSSTLGIPYDDAEERVDYEELQRSAEPYSLQQVPPGCLLLTAGVDVQGNRIEVVVRGFGVRGQRWVLDWAYFEGDPVREFGQQGSPWTALDAYLQRPLVNAHGKLLRFQAVAIDSGYLQNEVMHYVRTRRGRGVYAVKGAKNGWGLALSRVSKVDFKRTGVTVKGGAEQYQVGHATIKQQLYARLAADRDNGYADRLEHFSAALSEEFYRQLTAEVLDPVKKQFLLIKGRRNEALDCVVYAEAIAYHPTIRVQAMRESQWHALALLLEPGSPIDQAAEPVRRRRGGVLSSGIA